MTKKVRLLAMTGLVAGIFFLLGALGSTQLPKLRSWVLVQIENESRDHSPVRILPASVDVHFLPLGITLEGVRLFPKDEIKALLDPTEIQRVHATVSLWQLLQGKLRLTSIEITGARASIRIPKSKRRGGKPLDGLFESLNQIPISKIRLEDVSVYAVLEEPNIVIAVTGADIEAQKQRNGFSLAVESATVRMRDPESSATVLLDVEAAMTASPSRLQVEALKVRRGDSFFIAAAKGEGDVEALDLKEYELSLRSELVLDSMRNWVTKTFANSSWSKGIPPLKGRAFVEGKVKRTRNARPTGDFKAHAENFAVDKIRLGHLETTGTFKNDQIRLPNLLIRNPAGEATAESIAIDLKNENGVQTISLAGLAKVPALNVNELLFQFINKRLPVFLTINGEMPCRGTLLPVFGLDCKPLVRAKDILIKDGLDKKSTIIAGVPQMSGHGEIHVDKDGITYSTELAMPDSKGRSNGRIGFETGFKINFEGDHVAFKDIAHLANLKIEGVARVKGSTEGNSDVGKVALALEGNDVWFEDFWLGNAKANVSYAKDHVHFADVSGNAAVSRYSGDVDLDLKTKKIQVTARMPFFDTHDLLNIFSRRVQLSFPVTGTGQGSIQASGPLDLGHLSYDLKMSVFKGSVAGETFEQAHFDVKSVSGEVKAERVQMSKGPALISLTGAAHPDGKIETTIHGRGLRLEDTNTVAKSGFGISGAVEFEIAMNGPILAPETEMKGTLSRTLIGDQSMADSNFHLRFNRNSIEGTGHFLGDVIAGDFLIPFNAEAPFHLKASTKNWNFAPLFAAVAGPSSRKDYEGLLSTKIDFASQTGGFWNSTGEASIEKFSLARGSLKLENTGPMSLSMRGGHMKTQNLVLSGENTFLNIAESANPVSKMDLQVNGKIDLGLIALMTPFFEDLRGLLAFKLQLRGGDTPAQLLGSAYIEKGYLKFFDFPHAFEDIRADVLFNQQKIMFNTVRMEFGGGRISANGGMELKGYKDTPLNISGNFEKITLNVPDKVRTSGSGDFTFSGNGFPFLLKGNYNVSDGLVTKSFTGDSSALSTGVRREAYLPDFLIEENFIPLLVDMTVDLSKGVAVKNELVEGRGYGNLTIRGNPTKPAIGGSLTSDKETKIYFRDTEFLVAGANIEFNGSSEIDPKLYVSARARVDTYDVNLLVQGTGVKPDFVLTSVPPLPEKDIVSLLAFGATDTSLDKTIKSDQQASSTGLQVGSSIVKHNALSDAIKERLGFDVQLTTGFDETNLAVQKIVASRQITQNLGFSAGYALGKSQSSEAKLRYRLNERLSLVGAYQGNNYTETNIEQQQIHKDPDLFGLDVEYKFEFK